MTNKHQLKRPKVYPFCQFVQEINIYQSTLDLQVGGDCFALMSLLQAYCPNHHDQIVTNSSPLFSNPGIGMEKKIAYFFLGEALPFVIIMLDRYCNLLKHCFFNYYSIVLGYISMQCKQLYFLKSIE